MPTKSHYISVNGVSICRVLFLREKKKRQVISLDSTVVSAIRPLCQLDFRQLQYTNNI
ncbi:hypothetical protein SAMN04487891_11398 [Flagellimonas taeanensis]|uniref:Uncharacterized protein n=1 Tax=Flagellimonas taeanensis TaxID=1005926 RepID=A0A1M6UKZ9_9FLAO|nr:hypothetical protein SAMN04487891_11398 [Allomuricauda taeanensis]SHK69914.1 hypothetical protein SAMN05216293_1668 [Allomuricauda taeanensis]